jgi:hypothetical protein
MRVPYKILTRRPLPVSSDDGTVCDLHMRADDLLGYSVLKKRGQLAEVLRQLGIRPFSERSMELFRHELYERRRFYIGLYENGLLIFFISVGLTTLCLIPAIAGWFMSWKIGLGFTVPAVLGIVVAAYSHYIDPYVLSGTTGWNKTQLRGYGKEIPEFVLQQAIGIATLLPDASFTVHEFDLQKARGSFVHLMSVTQDGHSEIFFFAAWSEPSLKARSRA